MAKSDAWTLYGVNFTTALSTAEDFNGWRVSVRNFIDQKRRACCWWRDTSLDLWFQHDGTVRGVVLLGSLSADEVRSAFDRRWAVTLKPIEAEELRREVYFALHPTRIAQLEVQPRRYQGLRLTIGPRCVAPHPRLDVALGSPRFNESDNIAPMPLLL